MGHGTFQYASGIQNIALGTNSMKYIDLGSHNIAIGSETLKNQTTIFALNGNVNHNISIGYQALGNIETNSNYNIAIGSNSLSIIYGTHNIGIGQNTQSIGNTSPHTFNNIIIGHNSAAFGNNSVVIGNSAIGHTDSISIGNNASTQYYEGAIAIGQNVVATANNAFFTIPFRTPAPTGTQVYQTSTGELVKAISSIRYKENIQPLDNIEDHFKLLNPVRFQYKNRTDPNEQDIGFIAEEVYELFPEIVQKNKNGEIESIQYAKLTPILTKILQNINQRINILQTKI